MIGKATTANAAAKVIAASRARRAGLLPAKAASPAADPTVAKASKVTTASAGDGAAAVAAAITAAAAVVAITAVAPGVITAAAPATVPARKGVDRCPVRASRAKILKAPVHHRRLFCWLSSQL